ILCAGMGDLDQKVDRLAAVRRIREPGDALVRHSGGGLHDVHSLTTGYGSFIFKEGSNYEIQLGAIFRYGRCLELRHAVATDLMARTWVACDPLVDLGRQK